MEKKEYLNEEWYKKAKKKIIRTSIIILIVSILVGGALIAIGIVKNNSAKDEAIKLNEERKSTALKESQEKVDAAKKRLEEIATEKSTLTTQYNSKSQECDSLNMSDSDWYTKVNQCRRDASAIQSQINDLETEEFKLENADYTVYYDKAVAKNYLFLCFIGGGIALFGSFLALMVYLVAMKREIKAFTIQQSMPVTQEAIDKMAPTVGNAAGSIAQGITKGIKDGLNDSDDNK